MTLKSVSVANVWFGLVFSSVTQRTSVVANVWRLPWPVGFANRCGVILSCNLFQWVFRLESIKIDSAVDHWTSVFSRRFRRLCFVLLEFCQQVSTVPGKNKHGTTQRSS